MYVCRVLILCRTKLNSPSRLMTQPIQMRVLLCSPAAVTLHTLGGDGRFTQEALPCLMYHYGTNVYEPFMYAADGGPPRLHLLWLCCHPAKFELWRVDSPKQLRLICRYDGRSLCPSFEFASLKHVDMRHDRSYMQLVGDLLYVSLTNQIVCIDMQTITIHRIIQHSSFSPMKFLVTPATIYCHGHQPMPPIDGVSFVACIQPGINCNSYRFVGASMDNNTIYLSIDNKHYRRAMLSGDIEIGPADQYVPAAAIASDNIHYLGNGIFAGIAWSATTDRTTLRLDISDVDSNAYSIDIGDIRGAICRIVI